MDGDLTIQQRKLGYSRMFQFGSEKLAVTMRDTSGELQFFVPYEAIDVTSPSSHSIRSKLIQQAAIAAMVVCFLGTLINNRIGSIATITAIFLGLAFYLAQMRGLFLVRFLDFRMNPRPAGVKNDYLTIISAQNADVIVAEIKRRWRDRLRSLYGVANLAGNPQQEEARLRWLKDRDVISEAEFSEQMRRLHSIRDADQGELKPLVN